MAASDVRVRLWLRGGGGVGWGGGSSMSQGGGAVTGVQGLKLSVMEAIHSGDTHHKDFECVCASLWVSHIT